MSKITNITDLSQNEIFISNINDLNGSANRLIYKALYNAIIENKKLKAENLILKEKIQYQERINEYHINQLIKILEDNK